MRSPSILAQLLLHFFAITLFINFTYADDGDAPSGSVRGRIKTSDGQPASFVNITLKGTNKGTLSAEDGTYVLRHLPAGPHTLVATFVGLQPQEQVVIVADGQVTEVSFALTETARQLGEVQVRAFKSDNQKPITLGKVAIRPMDLPQAVAVVEREVLERQQSLRLSDVLMNTNGVYVMGNTGGSQEELAGRGFAFNSSNTFKNGVRFNNAAMPEISALERVEVLKGSSAILFGNVAAGGIINLVTKKPQFQSGGSASVRLGSFGFVKPSFDVYGGIGNSQRVAYRLNATYEQGNSFRDDVQSKRFYVNPSLLVNLSSKTNLLIEADYLNDDRTPDFGTGAINYAIADVPRSRFLGVSWGYNRIEQRSATATLTHQINQNWTVRAVGSAQGFTSDLFAATRPNAGQFIQTNGNWIRGIQRTQVDETYWIGQLDLTGQFTTGSIKHTLLVGADADQYRTNTTAYNPVARYDTINVFNLGQFRQRSDIPTLTARTLTNAPIDRAGVYVQDLISFSDKIKLLAGLRYSYQQTGSDVLTYADNKTTSVTNFADAVTPRVGFVYQPVPTTSLFVSYANSFNTNTGVDVSGNALAPSFIDQYEAGIKNDLFSGFLSANVTAYQIKNSNLAQTSLAGGNTNSNIRELAGEVTSRGIEVDLKTKQLDGFSFLGGYSYNQTKYTASNIYIVGSLLRYNPNHTANGSVYYAFQRTGGLRGLNLGLTAFYMGERVAGRSTRLTINNDTYRLISVPAFTQIDASVGYSLARFGVRAKVSNVLNVLSYQLHDDNSVNPIAPRMLSATVSYRW
ncbi:TonB-dependent siderophore receptor [Spirosoma arcticum]